MRVVGLERGYGCGKPLLRGEIDLASFDFPILPARDDEPWIGVWTEEEADFMVDCLERILALEPRFKAPSLMVDPTDVDWNEWVRRVIRNYLAIAETRDYRRLAVVSFIR